MTRYMLKMLKDVENGPSTPKTHVTTGNSGLISAGVEVLKPIHRYQPSAFNISTNLGAERKPP